MSELLSLFEVRGTEKARLEAALKSFRNLDLTWDSVTGYLSRLDFKNGDGNILFSWVFTWDAVTGYLTKVERS
jgi:hypothetical protein